MSDTIAKLRDLLLNSSKAGRLRGLLDSIYGAASTGAEAYGSASSPMSAEHSGLLGGLLMDMSPLGDAKSAYDGVQSAREGDWVGAGLGGLGALPMVPNFAGAIRNGTSEELLKKLYKESAIKKALYNKSDTYATMTPDDFLQLAMPIDRTHPETIANVQNLKKVGQFDDVPYLELGIDNKGRSVVSTHEGRHRALALKEQGVEEMPVVMAQRSMLQRQYPNMTREQWATWLQDIGQVMPESGSSNVVKYRK